MTGLYRRHSVCTLSQPLFHSPTRFSPSYSSARGIRIRTELDLYTMLRLGDPTRSLQRPPARRVDVPCPRPVRGFLRPATRFKFQLAQNRSIPRTILRRLSCLHDARSPVSRRRRHSNLKKDGARFVPRCFLRFVCLCDRLLSWACSERRGYVRSPWVITPSLIAQRTPGRRPQGVPPSLSLSLCSPPQIFCFS